MSLTEADGLVLSLCSSECCVSLVDDDGTSLSTSQSKLPLCDSGVGGDHGLYASELTPILGCECRVIICTLLEKTVVSCLGPSILYIRVRSSSSSDCASSNVCRASKTCLSLYARMTSIS